MGLLNIGWSGISAAQSNLVTTSHNTTNASNEHYTRQTVNQSANYPSAASGGFYGTGTVVNSITRYYSEHLETQLRDAQSRTNQLSAYYEQIMQVDNLLGSTDSGLASVISSFFSAVDAVSGNPNDLSVRQQMISVAETMAARFQSADDRLDELHQGLNSEIQATVEKINVYAQNIATLNRQILLARTQGAEPNDLLDHRNAAVSELAKLVDVKILENQSGGYNVFIGTGQALVMSETVYRLETEWSSISADIQIVTYDTNKAKVELPADVLSGGILGGLLDARTDVDSAKNSIGAIVIGMMQTFNTQHQLGADLNGNDGQAFFKQISPEVSPDLNNQGNAVVKASWTSISGLMAPGYRLERIDTGYQLLDMANNVLDTFVSLPREFNGFVIQSSGGIAVGDGFTLNADGIVADPDNAGAGTITVNVSNVQGSDYMLKRTLSGYSLLRMSDNTYIPVPSTFPAESMIVDGMVISIEQGSMMMGDQVMIRPTHDAADMFELNIRDPKEIAAGYAFRTEAATGNAGNATISAGRITALSPLEAHAPNLRETVTITFNNPPTSFSVNGTGTENPMNVPYVSGGEISYNGWSVEITGTPKAGDKFIISENAAGVADNRNTMALFGLQSENVIQGGSNSYGGSYRLLVSAVGTKTMLAEMSGEAEAAILVEKQEARDALSGVNLEEEAANLIRYQQAYQAASKVIQIAGELFDGILSAVQ